MDINREMEMMLGDDLDTKPKKSKKKKQNAKQADGL